ncbi:hypothetical protein RB195_014844 [Necator americanus]|uniref:Transmembrane protein n=1 Tax=Necator americanus TaxID=51031 RepID=A0ABR1E332_NECAM
MEMRRICSTDDEYRSERRFNPSCKKRDPYKLHFYVVPINHSKNSQRLSRNSLTIFLILQFFFTIGIDVAGLTWCSCFISTSRFPH